MSAAIVPVPETDVAIRARRGRRTGRKVATEIEKEMRIHAICKWLEMGYAGYELRSKITSTFQISEDQAILDTKRAREKIIETFAVERVELATSILAMYHLVFRAAMETRQLSAAVGALQGMARMTGVEAPKA